MEPGDVALVIPNRAMAADDVGAIHATVDRWARAGAAVTEVALDAVIFRDGELAGPDTSELGTHFEAYLRACQTLSKNVRREMAKGQSPGAAVKTVFVPPPASGQPDRLAVYLNLASADLWNAASHSSPHEFSGLLDMVDSTTEFRLNRPGSNETRNPATK